MKSEAIGAVIAIISGIISIVGFYIKSKYVQKTPLEEYEEDKKRIDKVLASHNIVRNSELLDGILPPKEVMSNEKNIINK